MLSAFGNYLLLLLCIFSFANYVKQFRRSFSPAHNTAFELRISKFFWIAKNILIILAISTLMYGFYISSPELSLVSEYSHPSMPNKYRLAAAWANHEGSMLLWLAAICFSSLIYFILFRSKELHPFINKVLENQSLILFIFTLYVLLISNPFVPNEHIIDPIHNLGLNPLLQDPSLTFHPPSLYLGYVGFVLCYSIAAAALQLRVNKLVGARLWALASWIFLTMGIFFGSKWSYRELGWGGYWFWDPVENASLMPWISAIALIHSLVIYEKRGLLFGWCVFLSILTFCLSIFGTFIVRSGIITSVHAFASDPSRGIFIMIIMALAIIYASFLHIYNFDRMIKIAQKSYIVSRDTFLKLNNILMMIALAIVLIGTIYPILSEIIYGIKISVGEQFFNELLRPIMYLVLILSYLSLCVNWQQDNLLRVLKNNIWGISIIVFTILLAAKLHNEVYIIIGITIAYMFSILQEFVSRKNYRQAILSLNHLALAILAFGIVLNSQYEVVENYRLKIGDEVFFLNQKIKFISLDYQKHENYISQISTIEISDIISKPTDRDIGQDIDQDQYVSRGDNDYFKIKYLAKPELRLYLVERSTSSEAFIIQDGLHHLLFNTYLPKDFSANQSSEVLNEIILNISYKAYINLVWLGALMIIITSLGHLCLVASRVLLRSSTVAIYFQQRQQE